MQTFTIERIYISSVEQSNADKACKRDDMAEFYRDCIIADSLARKKGTARVDFAAVNGAILKRWSPAGLKYVKERAWKMLEGKR